MKKRTALLLLTAFLVAALLAGCGASKTPVNVQSVAMITGYGTAGAFNICAGVVVAQDEIKVERDENRKVAELKVSVGQDVKKGDVLFVYDMEEMKLTIDKAELEIESLKNSITDFDTRVAQLEKEKASAPASEQLSYTVQIQSLQADKKEAQYNLTVKEKELESMKSTSESGEVLSPIDGKVQAINENGGTDNTTGQPLPYIALMQNGDYRVKGKINELNRSEFYEGARVVLRSRADSTQTWTGTISQIDQNNPDNNSGGMYYYGNNDDTTSSSSYPFYVSLDSTDGLMLGQHVYIEQDAGQGETQDGLWLDASYLVGSEEEGFRVWAADKHDKLEKRSVTTGEFDAERNQYQITGGLTPEDYIAYPAEDLEEGAPVVKNDSNDTPVVDPGMEPANPVDGGDYPEGGLIVDGNDEGGLIVDGSVGG